ncbi:hypothetical protein Bpfe_019318 [Biomphalaria pfeifferi]|uniref:Uncharacterized protein n=1 Tax=Biomphalaria pfeifferi TaxID=112525 RepID=A0AAD8F4M5_BIOPF|nr:hypothetical protein Bpfe_019318 [Biomphalaria pfeifferi]
MFSSRSSKMVTQLLISVLYISGVFLGLVQSFAITGQVKENQASSLPDGGNGLGVLNRSKRSATLSSPRLEKLFDTYVNLIQLNNPNPGNEYNRNDSPSDVTIDGIVNLDRGSRYLVDDDDDTMETTKGQKWALKRDLLKESNADNSVDTLGDSTNDLLDADLIRLLTHDDSTADDSQTLYAKSKRQQGWHFQYGKRSIPEYRRL